MAIYLKESADGSLNLLDVTVIGYSPKFQQQFPSIALSRIIKDRNPEIVIFMGRPNCEHPEGEALCKHIDCIDSIFNGRRSTIGICELVKICLQARRKMSVQNVKRYLSEILKNSNRCSYFATNDSCLSRGYSGGIQDFKCS